ncbi:uncharacterized protein LTR77_009592 [Saxophila tyrrhenica]|uniref:Uncharacterized protein n=1 Tax=Saxophila tyrrhenica TaxID=1690608 RepID=A0AAV9NYN1_9PEZI|nr:hypothetical protein LTR77_009592 [Saxophila tyrrhenica]
MYSEKTWNSWVLIPLWIAHLTFLLIFIGVLAVSMMEYAGDHEGQNNGTLTAFMVFFFIALIMSPLEMVLQSYRMLQPWLYLSFQVYKLVIAIIFTIVEIIEYTNQDWTSIAGWIRILMISLIAVTVVVGATFVPSVVYGAIVVHRRRKSPDYDYVKERNSEYEMAVESRRPRTTLASGGLR